MWSPGIGLQARTLPALLAIVIAVAGGAATVEAEPIRYRRQPLPKPQATAPRVSKPQRPTADQPAFFQPGPHDDPRLERGM